MRDLVIVTNRLSFHEFAKQGKLNAIHSNDYNAVAGQTPTVSTSSFNSHWCVCELLVYNKWQWRSRWRGGQWCPIFDPPDSDLSHRSNYYGFQTNSRNLFDLQPLSKKDITPHTWQWSSRSPSRSIQPWSHLWTILKVVPLWASLCHYVSWRMNVFWSRFLLFFQVGIAAAATLLVWASFGVADRGTKKSESGTSLFSFVSLPLMLTSKKATSSDQGGPHKADAHPTNIRPAPAPRIPGSQPTASKWV